MDWLDTVVFYGYLAMFNNIPMVTSVLGVIAGKQKTKPSSNSILGSKKLGSGDTSDDDDDD